jgi:hypothetical protein
MSCRVMLRRRGAVSLWPMERLQASNVEWVRYNNWPRAPRTHLHLHLRFWPLSINLAPPSASIQHALTSTIWETSVLRPPTSTTVDLEVSGVFRIVNMVLNFFLPGLQDVHISRVNSHPTIGNLDFCAIDEVTEQVQRLQDYNRRRSSLDKDSAARSKRNSSRSTSSPPPHSAKCQAVAERPRPLCEICT